MGDIIYIDRQQAYDMTNYRELVKMYAKKNAKKFEKAIETNMERYDAVMAEVLATRVAA